MKLLMIIVDTECREEVEVLFGPQSRLYGSNALGAVIYVKTRDSMVDYTEEGFEWLGRFVADYIARRLKA